MDLSEEDNKLLLNNIRLLDLNENLTYLTFFSYKLSFASNVVKRINNILLCNDCYNNDLNLINLKINYPNDYHKNCVTCGKDVKNIELYSVTEYFSKFLEKGAHGEMINRFSSFVNYKNNNVNFTNIIFESKFEHGESLLHIACKSFDIEVIKLLLEKIDINTLSDNKQNCLHYLLSYWNSIVTVKDIYKKVECFKYLYPKINKNQKDIYGNNYLQVLLTNVESSYLKKLDSIINLLIKTDIFYRNNDNLTILDIAINKNNKIAQKINDFMNVYYRLLLEKIFLCKDVIDNILIFIDKVPEEKININYDDEQYDNIRCLIS